MRKGSQESGEIGGAAAAAAVVLPVDENAV